MIDTIENEPLMHWSDPRNGNVFLRRFDPRMLLPDGFIIKQEIQPKGVKRGIKVWVRIKYDREYVVAKLRKEVITPLGIRDYSTFQKLISEAWKG